MQRPKLHSAVPLLLAGGCGAASVLAFAPFGWFPLIAITLAALYALLMRDAESLSERRESQLTLAKKGAATGGGFGLGFFLAGVSWVYVSLSVFGGMAAPLAGLTTLLFCAFLSLYPALVGAVFVRCRPPDAVQRIALFAALWATTEWLRGWIFTGFPWLAVGYAQTPPSPLAGYAPIIGVFGLSFLTAATAAALGEMTFAWRQNTRRGARTTYRFRLLGLAAFVVVLWAGGGALREVRWTHPSGEPVTVALLQGNVAQDLKWRPERFYESLRTYYELARDNPAQLTLLPETALPAFLDQIPGEYIEAMKALAERQRGDVVFGIPVRDESGYTNSAVSIGHSAPQRYNKAHLVPFGEFVPPGFGWFLKIANIPMSNFTPGSLPQSPMAIGGQHLALNICYEDAFGEEIIRALPEATLLANVSNVAWFGDSLAPQQHLQIARLRALETGRVMLRATNTGMTAIIRPDGHVETALAPFTRGALRGVVQGYEGATPYVRWGNWPVVAFALVLIGVILLRARAR